MEKRVILDNYDALVLVVDELVDGGFEFLSFLFFQVHFLSLPLLVFLRSFSFSRLKIFGPLRIILESDPAQIAARISMNAGEGDQIGTGASPKTEEALSKAWTTALSLGKALLK